MIYIIREPSGEIWKGASPKVAWVKTNAAKNAWTQRNLDYREWKGGWDREAEPNGWSIEAVV